MKNSKDKIINDLLNLKITDYIYLYDMEKYQLEILRNGEEYSSNLNKERSHIVYIKYNNDRISIGNLLKPFEYPKFKNFNFHNTYNGVKLTFEQIVDLIIFLGKIDNLKAFA